MTNPYEKGVIIALCARDAGVRVCCGVGDGAREREVEIAEGVGCLFCRLVIGSRKRAPRVWRGRETKVYRSY